MRRDFLAHLREWGSADSDFDGAALALGELVSNVVEHAPGPLHVNLEWSKCAPILHVDDCGPGFALVARLPAETLSERGRGLFLITELVGPLSVRRKGDAGTRVSVTIPVHRKECDRACS